MIDLYLKKTWKTIKAQLFPTIPRAMFSIFMIIIFVDFISGGKFGYIAFLRFELQKIFVGANWQFMLILLILLWRRK